MTDKDCMEKLGHMMVTNSCLQPFFREKTILKDSSFVGESCFVFPHVQKHKFSNIIWSNHTQYSCKRFLFLKRTLESQNRLK